MKFWLTRALKNSDSRLNSNTHKKRNTTKTHSNTTQHSVNQYKHNRVRGTLIPIVRDGISTNDTIIGLRERR